MTISAISVDRASPVPLYFQVARQLETAIEAGALAAGTRMENEVHLSERLGVSRPTVRAAFGYLVSKGLVVRRRGAGTLVAERRIARDLKLTSLHDDLTAAGRAPSTRVLKNEITHPDQRAARALGIPEQALVLCLERIRFAAGEPVALMRNFLPSGLVHLSTSMLAEHGLYELLRAAGIRPASATQRISARNASAAEAKMLGENRGAALLTMERISRDESGRTVEYGLHVYRPSRYAFTIKLPAGTAAR
ncbi:MAG TPA: GntR family transcriptional regulator [Streptosporangiaceae bacterium]|nr:GntR family transcriptional regulator [Streptosporangiaceae bacterium]